MLVKLSEAVLRRVANDPAAPEVGYYRELARGIRYVYKVPSWVPTSELLAGIVFNVNDAYTGDGRRVVKFHKDISSIYPPRSYLHESSPLFKAYGVPWAYKNLSWLLYGSELQPAEEWNAYAEISQKLLTL